DPAPVPGTDEPLVRRTASEAERAAAVRALVLDEEQPAAVLEHEVPVVAEEDGVVLARVQDGDGHAATAERLHSDAVRARRPCRHPAGTRIASPSRSGNGGFSPPTSRSTSPLVTDTTVGSPYVRVANGWRGST